MDKKINRKNMLNKIKSYYEIERDSDFASILHIPPQTYATWRARNTFNASKILKAFPEINPQWLMTGEGEMLRVSCGSVHGSGSVVGIVGTSHNVSGVSVNGAPADSVAQIAEKDRIIAEQSRAISRLSELLHEKMDFLRNNSIDKVHAPHAPTQEKRNKNKK